MADVCVLTRDWATVSGTVSAPVWSAISRARKKKMSTTAATVGLSAVTGSEEEGTERGKSEVGR